MYNDQKQKNTGDLKQKADFNVLKSTNQPSIYFHLKTGTLIFLSLNLMSYFKKGSTDQRIQ